MIVDASAIVAIATQEEDAERFHEALEAHDGPKFMSPVNAWEIATRLNLMGDDDAARHVARLLRFYGVVIAPVGDGEYAHAVEAQRNYGKKNHPARLNLGDCFAYALAKTRDEPLLFKGDDFPQTDITSALA